MDVDSPPPPATADAPGVDGAAAGATPMAVSPSPQPQPQAEAAAQPAGAPAPQPASFPTPLTRVYYNPELSQFTLGEDHPMVPNRLHLTHRLAELCGLFDDPNVTVVKEYPPATIEQLRRFHTDEYIAFLEYLDTLDLANMTVEQQQELFGDDLSMFGLSVCRPPGEGGAGSGDEEAAAGADGAGPGPSSKQQEAKEQQAALAKQQAAARAKAKADRDAQRARDREKAREQQEASERDYRPTSHRAKPLAVVKPELKPADPAAGAQADVGVPPQVIALAIQLLTKLAPAGSGELTSEQQVKLIAYIKQNMASLQPQAQAALMAGAGQDRAASLPGRAAVQMVRPGQQQAGGGGKGGGGGGDGGKKRKAEGGSKSKKKSKKSKKGKYDSDEDEEEEEEISDEGDDEPTAEPREGKEAGVGPARPSRQAANAVAALTNAVRATEAEPSDSEEDEDEDDEDDDDEGGDCPIFPGLLKYVGLQAAGSILAARDLASGACDVAVHWGGGMHHGMPYRAFGFCYINDLVLAILELMAVCGRVLYIDIDVHHGDGVETAFKRSEKVLTISLHKWDDGRMQASMDTLNYGKPQRPVFFPGTGKKNDLGEGNGKYFTVNVPLQDDITDESYINVYRQVIKTAFEKFKPQAVVLQCGCDSVAGDKLGRFNLSIRGHSRCVELVRDLCRNGGVEAGPPTGQPRFGDPNRWRIPLLVTGGGGYTPPLVARCWALETAVLLGKTLAEAMPPAVAEAEDLKDLGPSYFKETQLSRPPSAPYSMCLDTILLPGAHRQMDSDYSLSRLAAYLTSNMARINLKEAPPPAPEEAKEGEKKEGEAGKEGDKKEGDKEGEKKRSRKKVHTGPGVPDPLKHLTNPNNYPDAQDYIEEQKERVQASAAWASKMPPPPVPKGKKAQAGANAAAGGAAAGGKAGAGGKAAAGGKAGAAAASPAGKAGAAASPAPGGDAARAALLTAAGQPQAGAPVAAAPAPAPSFIPGLPMIMPYQPKPAGGQ
ncbi:hypothetical protein HYH03_003450 [Edaphochlamys debaryana]|uniref:Histone deacetylase domain-containing protein n=1 Tax=Edaphochlamys debaryana TaxID=47281 RepID=A0A835YHD7_9CHLO|nr:hypothetical protein HYH03_003450 [Edaphochlamys debaryana]|eukprot:KAG2498710.1 hypothetical protein HYH03_003450 [Edaphochlamys debaryana]